jgi:hypothetical protein
MTGEQSMHRLRLIGRRVTTLAVLMLAACDSSSVAPENQEPDPDPPTEPGIETGKAVKFTAKPDSLFFGESFQLGVTDASKADAVATDFTWTTSDPTVAIIAADGSVVAAGSGSARITAQRGLQRDTIRLRVTLADASAPVPLIAGSSGSNEQRQCAIGNDNAVYCRTFSTANQSTTKFVKMPGAAGLQFTSVSTSFWAQCALELSGAIYCWGNNGHWHLASRINAPTDTGPIAVRTNLRFSQMSHGGHSQTCGVAIADQLAYCWGHNDQSQLGRITTLSDDSIPRPAPNVGQALQVSTDGFHVCVLAMDGLAHCAGQDGFYAGVANVGRVREIEPVVGGQRFTSISSGDNTQCAIGIDSKAYCWGDNRRGELGIGNTEQPTIRGPQLVAGGLTFKKVVTSFRNFSCGISTQDDLYCWGDFGLGARTPNSYTPMHIGKGTKFRDVSVRCGITMDGRALCWS